MSRLRVRWPLALVASAAIILVCLIGIELLPETTSVPETAAVSRTPAKARNVAHAPELDEQAMVATALSRPLFNPDRKPDKTTQPTQVASSEPTAELPRLAGILVSSDNRHAVFQASADDPPVVLDEGGTIAGWKIEHITPEAVSLSGPDGTKTLEPMFDPNAKVTQPALPVAPPPPPNAGQVAGNPNQRLPMPGPAFDPRRFQQNPTAAGMPFRPNMPGQFPPNPPRVVPVQPGNR